MGDWKGKAIALIFLGVALLGVSHVVFDTRSVFSGNTKLQLTEKIVRPHADDLHFHTTSKKASHQGPEDLQLWCQLDPENTKAENFWHFPHTSLGLLPCWSWFQRIMQARNQNMDSTTTNTARTTQCGFYMKNWTTNKSRHRATDPESWIAQLIKHMGCSVTEVEPTRSISADNCKANDTANCGGRSLALVHRLPRTVFVAMQCFERPEDAAALRTKVFQSLNVTDADTPRTAGTPARIAFVDRKLTRRILNLANITAAVRAAFPSASVESAYMEDMQPSEQFVFWGQHDIIITGHGAAVTNAIFMPPGNTSAVIEIYPPHYYHPFFMGLVKSAGIRGHYRYVNGVSNWLEDFQEHSLTRKERSFYRSVDLEPPVDDIVDLVRQAMSEGGFV